MILDSTSKVIQVILAEAKTTNDCEVNGCWADTASGSTFVPGSSDEVTNGTTAVTVIAAPAASTQRAVKELSVYNADTVQHFVTVRLFDGTNTRRIVGWEIPAGDTLYYSAESGWAILPASSGGSTVTGANPTATAGPAAVNGSATTFLRSDGAPAVQTATTGQLGLVKPDGTTITISGGTISSVSATGANPSATAGPTAVNGSATTFMRSDAAPLIQKASASQFGLVEVDGTTITATAGVISAFLGTHNSFAIYNGAIAVVNNTITPLAVASSFLFNTAGTQYSTSTGRFTPTVAGKYLFYLCASGQATTTAIQVACWIQMNGTATATGTTLAFAQAGTSATLSTNITGGITVVGAAAMNGSTDWVEWDGYMNGTGGGSELFRCGFGAIYLGP